MPSVPPQSGPSPRVGALLQHGLIGGMLSGVLGAAYHAWLIAHAPDHPVAVTGQTVALAAAFHGHRISEHFVTQGQRALWWALLMPAVLVLVLLVAGLVWMGVRTVRGGGGGRGG